MNELEVVRWGYTLKLAGGQWSYCIGTSSEITEDKMLIVRDESGVLVAYAAGEWLSVNRQIYKMPELYRAALEKMSAKTDVDHTHEINIRKGKCLRCGLTYLEIRDRKEPWYLSKEEVDDQGFLRRGPITKGPEWKDQPESPGLWVFSDEKWKWSSVLEITLDTLECGYEWMQKGRYYGPLPHDLRR